MDSIAIDPLLTVREVARALGVCDRTAWDLVWTGKVPHVKVGRCVRVATSDLKAYVAANKSRRPPPISKRPW